MVFRGITPNATTVADRKIGTEARLIRVTISLEKSRGSTGHEEQGSNGEK